MPVNPKAKLVENLFDTAHIEQQPTRKGYGEGLVLAGDENPAVVALCADLTESTQTVHFAKKYPERFVQIGVAEQNLATVASGMSAMGKVPFITSYAMFSPGRNWEQIRTTICYNEQNVKVIGSHSGVSVGPDGATHQAIEDMAIMRVLANMSVLTPCDVHEARKMTLAVSRVYGPYYLRFAREKTPVITTEETPFAIGKAQVFWEEPKGREADVAIIACGPLVYNALIAASELEREGLRVRVVNNPSVKPLDGETILDATRSAGAVVTVEEHQVAGGMGSAVAEFLSTRYPVPIRFVGVQNRFGESGEPAELIEHFGMDATHVREAALQVMRMK